MTYIQGIKKHIKQLENDIAEHNLIIEHNEKIIENYKEKTRLAMERVLIDMNALEKIKRILDKDD